MKKVLLGVGVVVLGYLAMCAFGDEELRVERKLEMNHSAHSIYQEVVSFKNWQNWSPWLQMDPNIQMTYTGKQGVGSSASWLSEHEKVGNGSQTIIQVTPDEYLLIDLVFDGQGGAQADFKMDALSINSTLVTWGFLMKTPFLARGFMMFIDFEKELGPMYENGLNNLYEHLIEQENLEKASLEQNTQSERSLGEIVADSVSGEQNQDTSEDHENSTANESQEQDFISKTEGKSINNLELNDLTNIAFDYISMDRGSDGKCKELLMGNDVTVQNDHDDKTITVRMSIVWKDQEKNKMAKYMEYEIQPASTIHVGCTRIAPNDDTKVRWNIIHTTFED